ncbi:MAG: hydantoinase B/oxoprolinase family protein [Minwuia sp.]|nr:hydantoinase B/oxoprolinase family protein [Minwuia sp.]
MTGLAEGGVGMGAGFAVVSGKDDRAEDEPYVNQLIIASSGGPASPVADGWITYGIPVVAGLMYRDSVEIDELKHPLQFQYLRIVTGSGGAGRLRGAPAMELSYGPTELPMDVLWPCDGTVYAPKGVRGGDAGSACQHFKVSANGLEEELPSIVEVQLQKGERVRGNHSGGGGYGSPMDRDPRKVLRDVLERYETPERARDVYGVVLTGSGDDESLALDVAATEKLRAERTAA